jgi:primosomal protein N'
MYIISVIPIQKGIPFSTLSYFHSESLVTGTIVTVPLGKQSTYGLVYESTSLIEAKTHIKQANFSLKKIKSVIGLSTFSFGVVEGLREASQRTLTPIGALAGVTINELFFDFLQEVGENLDTNKPVKDPVVVYGTLPDRIDEYKRIIRGAFALKQSVVLVAPSIRAVEFWYTTLAKGIASHSLMLHSKCTKRHQKTVLSTIKSSERPLFICTTPGFSTLPRKDISILILEDESSNLYKTHDRYEIDQRIVLESITKASRMTLVYGDTLPRFETLHKTGSTTLARSFTPDKLVIVPTDPYRTILPSETVELIRYCQKNKKSLFIYTNRKGIAPLSRCADCGTTVDCPTCTLPVVLRYKVVDGERQRLFICTHCGDTLPTTHVCSYCASWNITPVSVGTESLTDAVIALIGEDHVVTIDDDVTPDSKFTTSLVETLQKQKWFVMVGTQKVLPFIKSVDFVVIPFFDRILSVASPYVVEETLRLIMTCNEKTKDSLIICTKNPDFTITKQLATKKIQEIINDDMETRRQLKYPPFGVLLKLSVTVPSSHREMVTQKVELFFEGYEMSLVSARRISQDSMKILCIWVIQVDNSYLEDQGEALSAFLSEIRFPNKMDINPSRL